MVKGERNLRTCGLLDHNKNKARATGIFLPEADQQVKITFESNAQEIYSQEKTNKLNTSHSENENEQTSKQKQIKNNEDLVSEMRHKHRRVPKSYYRQNNETKHDAQYNLAHDNKSSKENSKVQNVKEKRIHLLNTELQANKPDTAEEETDDNRQGNLIKRLKRNQGPVEPPKLLDQGIRHGGNNGKNVTLSDEDSSISSFENGLLTCYGGQVLLSQEFNASEHCLDVSYLINGKHMQTKHDIVEPGYYYYIFYSDNDFVSNDIHAVFDIYKPTLQYENVTQACVNETECTFSLPMMTSDRVIVEVPTRDGIDHEIDDISLLVSTCHPRMGIYIIFPVSVLFLILGCAFV